jgi:glutathione synthase/RimK-type ligase-like ATP-grasp enzyme
MKVLVFGSKDYGSKNDPVVLANGVASDDVQADVVYWEDLVFHISTAGVKVTDHGQDVFVEPVSLIIATGWYKKELRDAAFALGLIAEYQNVRLWNSEIARQRSTTKLSCLVQLALQGIDVPQTTFSLGDASVVELQPLPFIAKAPAASRGESNFLVRTEDQRQEVLGKGKSFLVQPFLSNDHDLRVICFDGLPSLVLKRARPEGSETHLNNTSQGGISEWLDLGQVPQELLTVSQKICKIMSREMAGIDFIPDASSPNGYSCLEVNAIPQLTTGVDVNKKMDALKESINGMKERTS